MSLYFRYADSDENTQRVALDIFSSVENYVSSLSNNHTKLNEYLQEIKQLEAKFLSNCITRDKGNNNKDFNKNLVLPFPLMWIFKIQVKSATQEVVLKKNEKFERGCNRKIKGYCRKGNDHDWRSCPIRKEDEKNNIFKEHPGKTN
uniref:Uncharacterized protein n=1 Tax=Lactuca sativa TaxID=4236 RepID=A0A9R1V2Q2_LACSA|nr:hypothetical protein LSAT_V11C700374640 [Lactuca sativa]